MRLSKTTFRGAAFPDSVVRLSPKKNGIEFLGNVGGDSLKGRYVRAPKGSGESELLLYFKDFDFTPVLSAMMERDLPTVMSVKATGDLSFSGSLSEWRTVNGSAASATARSRAVAGSGAEATGAGPIGLENEWDGPVSTKPSIANQLPFDFKTPNAELFVATNVMLGDAVML